MKISNMLFLITLVTGHTIAMQRGIKFYKKELESYGEKEKQKNNPSQTNILKKLPLELIIQVMDFLHLGDSGYKYLQLYRKAPITKEQAERYINEFYEKELLSSKNLGSFIEKIEGHYSKLEDNFPDYVVLQKAYEEVITGKDNLLQEAESIANEINTAIMQQNWMAVKKILKKVIKAKKALILDNNDDLDILRVRKRLKAIMQISLILNKVKHDAYYALVTMLLKPSPLVIITPMVVTWAIIVYNHLEYMEYINTGRRLRWFTAVIGAVGVVFMIDIYQRIFSSNPNIVSAREKFEKILKFLAEEKGKLRQSLSKLEKDIK